MAAIDFNFNKGLPADLDAERLLLGCVLLDYTKHWRTIEGLNSEDFSLEAHRRVHAAMAKLVEEGDAIDRITLADELRKRGQIEAVGGLSFLLSLDEGMPDIPNPESYLKIVREKSTLRKLIFASKKVIDRCLIAGEDPSAIALTMEDSAREFQVIQGTAEGGRDSSDIIADFPGGVGAFLDPSQRVQGIQTGFTRIDEMTGGLRGGELIILAARPAMGKAQPLYSKILTPTGWTTMAEVAVGMRVASVNRVESIVIGVFPQGTKDIYRLTLSDGRTVDACDEHLWNVKCRYWPLWRTVTTRQIQYLLENKRYQRRIWLDTCAASEWPDANLPLDPWLLGALLGDGSCGRQNIRITTADVAIRDRVSSILVPGYSLTPSGRYGYRISGGRTGGKPNIYIDAIRSLGLAGKHSDSKFIPDSYKNASLAQRMDLLRGLMDTDGTVEPSGTIRYSTISRRLAEDVQFLARSCGALCSIKTRIPTFTHKGEKKNGQLTFVLTIRHARPHEFFWLPRKVAKLINRRLRAIPRLTISSIERIGREEAKCIAVSHPSKLYITDEFVVTHNTALAMNISQHVAAKSDPDVVEALRMRKTVGKSDMEALSGVAFFSLEMSAPSLLERVICGEARVDQHKFRLGWLNREERSSLQHVLSLQQNIPLYIDDSPGLTLAALSQKLRYMVARKGVKLAVIDYIGLMSSKAENRQNEVSKISRGLKLLSKELDIPVMALSQLNRSVETRTIGSFTPQLSDLRESGSIEQDADIVMFLVRPEVYKRDRTDLRGLAEAIIAKQRNGPIGKVDLTFLHSFTRFENRSKERDDEQVDGESAPEPTKKPRKSKQQGFDL